MRKIDYILLAHTLKSDMQALNMQRDAQMAYGLKSDVTGSELEHVMHAVKALERQITYIRSLAQTLSMKLQVDRKAFLNECGIYSGSTFE